MDSYRKRFGFYFIMYAYHIEEAIQMNVQNLRDNYPKLISHLKDNDYSKMYVDRFRREMARILKCADKKGWLCYADVYRDYTKT